MPIAFIVQTTHVVFFRASLLGDSVFYRQSSPNAANHILILSELQLIAHQRIHHQFFDFLCCFFSNPCD